MGIFVRVQTNPVSCTAKLQKKHLKIAQTFLAQGNVQVFMSFSLQETHGDEEVLEHPIGPVKS